jgi:hypothetical protein
MASPPPQGHHWHFPIFCQTQKTQILLGKTSLSLTSQRLFFALPNLEHPLSLALHQQPAIGNFKGNLTLTF